MNSGCTRCVGNWIFVCWSAGFDDSRLLQTQCWAILCVFTYFLTKKYNNRQIWKILAATQGSKNYGSESERLLFSCFSLVILSLFFVWQLFLLFLCFSLALVFLSCLTIISLLLFLLFEKREIYFSQQQLESESESESESE